MQEDDEDKSAQGLVGALITSSRSLAVAAPQLQLGET
jgi:hypothetical protein